MLLCVAVVLAVIVCIFVNRPLLVVLMGRYFAFAGNKGACDSNFKPKELCEHNKKFLYLKGGHPGLKSLIGNAVAQGGGQIDDIDDPAKLLFCGDYKAGSRRSRRAETLVYAAKRAE